MRPRWILFVPMAYACTFDYGALQGKATNGDGAAMDVAMTADAADAGPWLTEVAPLDLAGSDTGDVPIGLDTARDSSVALDLGGVEGGGAGGTVGTGGAGTGGVVGTGGGQAGSGGATSTGGLVGSGGAQTGGVSGAGGVIGTGGLAGTGGVATGGTVSTGGSATGGTPATGGAGGSGGCMTLFTSATDFAAATSAMTSVVEDFTRDASGAPVADSFFSVTYGDYYYQSSTLTFQSLGVQPDHNPGALDRTIVGDYGSIMSVATNIVARDGLVGSFSTPQNAVGLAWKVDKGAQAATLVVATSDQTFTFPLAPPEQAFAGVVSHCVSPIVSFRLLPPIPSEWWRLLSVTFSR